MDASLLAGHSWSTVRISGWMCLRPRILANWMNWNRHDQNVTGLDAHFAVHSVLRINKPQQLSFPWMCGCRYCTIYVASSFDLPNIPTSHIHWSCTVFFWWTYFLFLTWQLGTERENEVGSHWRPRIRPKASVALLYKTRSLIETRPGNGKQRVQGCKFLKYLLPPIYIFVYIYMYIYIYVFIYIDT